MSEVPEEPAIEDLPSSPSAAFAEGWRMGWIAARDDAYQRGLEDAAKVLDRHEGVPCEPNSAWPDRFSQGYETGQMDAASSWKRAIRALTKTEDEA